MAEQALFKIGSGSLPSNASSFSIDSISPLYRHFELIVHMHSGGTAGSGLFFTLSAQNNPYYNMDSINTYFNNSVDGQVRTANNSFYINYPQFYSGNRATFRLFAFDYSQGNKQPLVQFNYSDGTSGASRKVGSVFNTTQAISSIQIYGTHPDFEFSDETYWELWGYK